MADAEEGSAFPRPLTRVQSLRSRLRHRWDEVTAIVRHYPSTALVPLAVMLLLIALGVSLVLVVARQSENAARQAAASQANEVAVSLRITLALSFAPVKSLALMVKLQPEWPIIRSQFQSIGASLMDDPELFKNTALFISPQGVIKDSVPLDIRTIFAVGLSNFNLTDAALNAGDLETPQQIEELRRLVRASALAAMDESPDAFDVFGPVVVAPSNGADVLFLRSPIYIRNVSADARFGTDFTPPMNCTTDICPPLSCSNTSCTPAICEPAAVRACERKFYNPDTRARFWGFCSANLEMTTILAQSLSGLDAEGYTYQLVILDGSGAPVRVLRPVGGQLGMLGEEDSPVSADIRQKGVHWRLYLRPADGFTPQWRNPVLAMGVAACAILGVLQFLLLLSRRSHQVLLEALLPEGVVRNLRERPNWAQDVFQLTSVQMLDSGTPADKILGMVSMLLQGDMPSLQDILLVRTAILESYDIYRPVDLDAQMQVAKLDHEVAQSLMTQLGTKAASSKYKLRSPLSMVLYGHDVILESSRGESGSRSSPSESEHGGSSSLSLPDALISLMAPRAASDRPGEPAQLAPHSEPYWPKLGLSIPARPLYDEVEKLLAAAEHEWQLDAFALAEASAGHALSSLTFFYISRQGLIDHFALDGAKLARFLGHIEAGCRASNPYHNQIQAAGVVHSMHMIMTHGGLVPHYCDPLTQLAGYLAAAIHDYDHAGFTNDFLIASEDPLALVYNDCSPLENHHLAAAFTALKHPRMNFPAGMDNASVMKLRKLMIDMVMATDMKQHFTIVSHFSTIHRIASTARSVQLSDSPATDTRPVPLDEAERLLSLQMALKCADLAHLAAAWPVHERWVACMEEEFFLQGDHEAALGLPVSPLFDRRGKGASKGQVGFFDFVAIPLFNNFVTVFPNTRAMLAAILSNYRTWVALQQQESESLATSSRISSSSLQLR